MLVKLAPILSGLLLLALVGCNGGEEAATGTPSGTGTPAATGSPRATPATGAHGAKGFTILVDSWGDTDSRDGFLTLREAILIANGQLAVADLDSDEKDNVGGKPGAESADTIGFFTEAFPADAPASISLTSTLPTMSGGNDTLDGSAAGVIINGGKGGFDCLHIASSGNTIKGLQIQNCLTGVVLEMAAANNTIGGSAKGARNVISGNDAVGIRIESSGNVVQGNYIGTDPSGTAANPNEMEGIWIAPGGQNNIIGGSKPEERNILSGNGLFGVSLDGQGTTGNVVKGNYIGVDVSGRKGLRNRYGMVLVNGPQGNTIGGSDPADANIISGNQSGGILIRSAGTSNNLIIGNYIGTDASESEPLGNGTGIWILEGANGNIIGSTTAGEGNVIAHNLIYAVQVDSPETTGNQIRGNSIYASAREGIMNKEGGAGGIAAPKLTAANPITGTACPNCNVDIYSDDADEGKVYEGSTQADAEGRFTFDEAPSGPYVTAIAVDAAGNTSAFSIPLSVPRT